MDRSCYYHRRLNMMKTQSVARFRHGWILAHSSSWRLLDVVCLVMLHSEGQIKDYDFESCNARCLDTGASTVHKSLSPIDP
jgi:hypothetical protein